MKTTKTLTQGQLKKVRRRGRLAAMTPAERKANDKHRAEIKAQAKAQKTSPVANSHFNAQQNVNEAGRESNPVVIPADTSDNYQGKPAVHLTGEADRRTLAYRPLIAVQKVQGSFAQDEEKIPEPYHYKPRKVRAGTEGNFDRYWNEAVKQKLNPYVYIEEITARRKAEKLNKHPAKPATHLS